MKYFHAILIETSGGDYQKYLENLCVNIMGDEHRYKIERMSHPDVFFLPESSKQIDFDLKSIGVDEIRWLKKNCFLSPTESDFKIFIINNAHKITIQAQNAMLKILENPPKFVYFILLCENSKALIPTLLSRVQILRLDIQDNMHFKQKSVFKVAFELFENLITNKKYDVLKLMSKYLKEREIFKEILILTRNLIIEKCRTNPEFINIADNLSESLNLLSHNININLICCLITF
ncbi:MAG: hypothetical protein NkDv07_0076 [Candidatus Improbicoccus devescovinae]|nr:MAG: hypothetical protein NkDv07_0076 [Candidatus Improbicoccus devescovinae]